MYFLDCIHKGHECRVGVSLNSDRIFLQFLAPYLGIVNEYGWAYGWLPIVDGDFSFTYIP